MSLKSALSHPLTRLAVTAAAVIQVSACAPHVATAPVPAQKYLFASEVSGRGKPMILVPGLFSPASVWDGVVEHYRGQFQIHVLQLPGMAGSAPVNDTSLLAHVAADHGLDAPALPFITPTGVAMTRPVGRCEPPVERNRDNLRLL